MKEILKLGFILFMFCAVASGVLAFVNKMTKDKIAENKMKVESEARSEVLPNVQFSGPFTIDPGTPDSLVYYSGKDASGTLMGYTFVAMGRGYSSNVRTMVAVDPSFKILKLKVIDQNETPGLGTNSTKPNFSGKFEKKGVDELVVDKDGGPVKSITGSTITTRAITKSIKKALTALEKGLKMNSTPSSTATVAVAGGSK